MVSSAKKEISHWLEFSLGQKKMVVTLLHSLTFTLLPDLWAALRCEVQQQIG